MTGGVGGARLAWHDIPEPVRAGVERLLGGPVVEARSQPGGYSPGSADRVVAATGRRAFVKAAGLSVNADTPRIHRAEAAVTALLPAGVPAPGFIGAVEHEDWIALVLEDVEARHPSTPWKKRELEAVLDALQALAEVEVPADLPLADLVAEVRADGSSWRSVDVDALPELPYGLDTWLRVHVEEVMDAAARAPGDVRGDRLVHFDTRADNILLRADGGVVFVDWPWAARGVPWFDALLLLVNVRYYDAAFDPEALISRHPVFTDMPADAATRVLAAYAGLFLERSLLPAPDGMPTIRTFQRDQAIVVLDWVRDRWERT